MYRFVRGSAEQKGLPGYWQDVDLSAMTFHEIYTRYSGAYAILELVEMKTNYSFDFSQAPLDIRQLDLKFGDWLLLVGNKTIPFLEEGVMEKEVVTASFFDAWVHGFKILGYNRGIHEDRYLTQDQIIDLRLTKEDVNYQDVADSCLFTVNGTFYNHFPTDVGIVIPDGARSALIAKDNRVGILNLASIGTIKTFDITEEMIVDTKASFPMANSVYLNVPGLDLTQQTVFLVIGGYLHALDGWYSQVGTNLIKLDFKRFPWIKRYWKLKDKIDLPDFDIEEYQNRPDKVNLAELFSNDTITKLITMPQSFVVAINKTGVRVTDEMVHLGELGGRYYSYGKPNLPLFDEEGELVEYTSYRGADDVWVMRVTPELRQNYLLRYMPWNEQKVVTNHRVTTQPTMYRELFFKKIMVSKDK